MASGTLGVNGSNSRERHRWGNGNNKVYTRKFHTKGVKNNAAASTATLTSASIPAINGNSNCENKAEVASATTSNCHESNENANEDRRSKDDDNNIKDVSDNHQSAQTLATEEANSSNGKGLANGDEVLKPVLRRIDDRVKIVLQAAKSKDELRELKRTLVSELDHVRTLVKKLEAKELELTVAGDCWYSHSQYSASDVRDRGSSMRVNSDLNDVLKPTYSGATFSGGVGSYSYSHSHSQSQYSGNDARDKGGSIRVNYDANEVLKPTYSNPTVAAGGGYSQSQFSVNDVRERGGLMRVNSDVGDVGHRDSRPFRQFSVSVMDNNHRIGGGVEFVEKEKRTPKANQYYRNSEFLLGKDRLPPESHKKLKPNSGKKNGGEMGYGFGRVDKYRIQVFRSCSNLLQRLIKHKFGWVFNEPVNVKALGLNDYYDIIKQAMDLGTINCRLAQNYYKSPRQFAEDVRLTFNNAMTYNPKGHDVHIMAEQLLNMFEEKWKVIEAEYQPEWRFQMYHDVGLSLTIPSSRKVPSLHLPAQTSLPMRTLERSESMTVTVDPKMRPSSFAHVGRTPVPKKPKAKDPNKRDMTYEEKQKLSANLQNLPSEKLDNIVQIIKKRDSALSQRDDEIEVDIDGVDAETLWELDRFVTNYKKNLSKNKRKAELALQARAEAGHAIPTLNPATANVEALKENKTGEMNISNSPVQEEKQVDNASRSSSSSSSSSDSGSSSSDSDTDSSSADGSDAKNSPRT